MTAHAVVAADGVKMVCPEYPIGVAGSVMSVLWNGARANSHGMALGSARARSLLLREQRRLYLRRILNLNRGHREPLRARPGSRRTCLARSVPQTRRGTHDVIGNLPASEKFMHPSPPFNHGKQTIFRYSLLIFNQQIIHGI